VDRAQARLTYRSRSAPTPLFPIRSRFHADNNMLWPRDSGPGAPAHSARLPTRIAVLLNTRRR
jgi:hypothetical protein